MYHIQAFADVLPFERYVLQKMTLDKQCVTHQNFVSFDATVPSPAIKNSEGVALFLGDTCTSM